MIVKRGDIFYADLSPVVGSEQGGIRPVLIIQNNVGNKYSPTVIVAAITSQLNKSKMPTHIEIDALEFGLSKHSVILLEPSSRLYSVWTCKCANAMRFLPFLLCFYKFLSVL